jgi:hypothetical protein
MSNTDSESRPQDNYPIPPVRILVDAPERPDRYRGARVMNTFEVADDLARSAANLQEGNMESPPQAAVPQVHAAAPDTGGALIEAAKGVQTAREHLAQRRARLAELSEKSHELGKLDADVAEISEQRTSQLAEAMLNGKRANTAKLDERHTAAVVVREKRRDEITAVGRALVIMQAQAEDAGSALAECERVYNEARADHLTAMNSAGALTLQFRTAVDKARECLQEMPAHFRERLLNSKADLQSDQLPAAEALEMIVMSRAKEALIAARQLADIPPPPAPKSLGWVWADGYIHDEPEPVPELQPLATVGLVRTET